jgi:hypothetical protein
MLLLTSFLTLVLFAVRAHAQPRPAERVPLLILLTSNLSWDDLQADGPLRSVRQLAGTGSVALLNTAVAGEATEASAYLSVGSGERMAAPGERGPRILVDEVPLTIADITAEVYPAKGLEGNAVRPVYFRRFGTPSPPDAIGLALGLPTMERVQPSPSGRADAGSPFTATGARQWSAWTGKGLFIRDR